MIRDEAIIRANNGTGRGRSRFHVISRRRIVTLPSQPAVLALADGTVFRGRSIGAPGAAVGEVVFNTAMTGYQEILTDPSYCGQIVTLTYPHIGNTGANREDEEAGRIFAAGLVIRDLPTRASSWRVEWSLSEYLERGNVVAIAGVDTRRLTRLVREKGAQNGCILSGAEATEALARARLKALLVDRAALDRADTLFKTQSITEAEYDWNLGVNLKGVFNFTKSVVRGMMKRRAGVILNIASVVGLIGNAGQANYAASKAGVVGMTKSKIGRAHV